MKMFSTNSVLALLNVTAAIGMAPLGHVIDCQSNYVLFAQFLFGNGAKMSIARK